MIKIVLGDDTGESRKKFVQLRAQYEASDCLTISIDKHSLPDLDKWLYDSTSLFSQKKAFFGENILSRKGNREKLKKFDRRGGDIDIVIWEESIPSRAVKFYFTHAQIIDVKLDSNIFKFLDALYPANFKMVYDHLSRILDTVEPNVILFMMQRRMRELLMIKGGVASPKLAVWQLNKLEVQARKWDGNTLRSFYDKLFSIERIAKTNSGGYSMKESLDILFCFYL